MLDKHNSDLECISDFIWEEVSEKQQSVEETTRKNQYLQHLLLRKKFTLQAS